MSANGLLLINAATSLYMTGLIWFVQVVHYPLFARIPSARFQDYEQRHQRLTSFVVAPVMLLELAASVAILVVGPLSTSNWVASGLTGVVWASTVGLQMPLHDRLAKGFDTAAIQVLVRSNWIRTVAWTVRSVLLIAKLAQP